MRPHPFVRAYLAGIAVPTVFLLVIMLVFAWQRVYFEVSSQFVVPLPAHPLERALIFPMAVVPNLWGVWNMLRLGLRQRWHVSTGVFGSLLPIVLMPVGVLLARTLDVFTIQWRFALPMLPIGMAVYYLAWKYIVGFLNEELGVG
jgi:hypothetical protein